MTTRFRTLLLLGFTALMTTSAGCIVETTNGGGSGSGCASQRYFQVYWSVSDAGGQYTCSQAPLSHVELVTNNGTFLVGKECRATNYMGFIFDFAGSTNGGLPFGTYVTAANLVSDTVPPTILSTAPGAGSGYYIDTCAPVTAAYPFEI